VADRRCPRQDEMLAERDLEHLAACPDCAELVALADAVLEERGIAMSEACVPPSGAVWWRIRMRAYREAERAATRTVTIVQAIAVAAAVIITLLLFARPALPPATDWGLPVLIAVAASLALAPAALWLALTE
jgi:hypothetical protein